MSGAFLAWALQQEGKPYRWNADGPDAFDCSGLICYGVYLIGGPDWRATHNCKRLWAELEPTTAPLPGDLVFYGPKGAPNHVMIYTGDGRVYGACGGNSDTTTLEIALEKKAKVRYCSRIHYRPDFLGFRKLGDFHV